MKIRHLRLVLALALAVLSTLVVAGPALAAPARIVFTRTQLYTSPGESVDTSEFGIYLVNVDGTGLTRLTSGDHHRVEDVSPDGTRVVYLDHGRETSELWEMSIDGHPDQRRRIATGAHMAAYSPDGGRLAWHAGGRIVVARADGRDPRAIGEGSQPVWSADGSRILFTAQVDGDHVGIFSMAPDGTGRRQVLVADGHTRPSGIAVRPTGDEIAYTQTDFGGNATRLYVARADGTHRREIPDAGIDPNFDTSLDYSDDGGRLVYVATDRLVTIRTDGTDRRQVIAPDAGGPFYPVYVGNAPGTVPVQGGFDGDTVTTERLDAATPTAAAIAASRQLWSDQDGRLPAGSTQHALPRATYAVLARDDNFADSLAGSALTFRGPLLFTSSGHLDAQTRAELDRILGPRGLVYVLGGDKAISVAVEEALLTDGYAVTRLAGPSRVETAIAVADKVRGQFLDHRRVVLARADGPGTAAWADSITGGALAADARIPLLLTPSDELHPAVRRWLHRSDPYVVSQTLLLGGPSALSAKVEQAVPSPLRIHGAARDETATEIARRLWRVEPSGTRRYTVVNGYADDGWAWGLAAAGLADRADAPLLMVAPDTVPSATATAVTGCRQVDLLVVGDTRMVSPARVDELNAADTRC